MTELHPDVESLAFLLGTWKGNGTGDYPTVAPFRYREHTRFTHDGRPFLYYEQDTWRPAADGTEVPSHTERGFLRGYADGRVEAVIAQTGGTAEIAVGESDGARVELESTTVARSPSAKDVIGLWRAWTRDGEALVADVEMAAVGAARAWHVTARLLPNRPA